MCTALLLKHPQVGPQLIQRLSETWPIRKIFYLKFLKITLIIFVPFTQRQRKNFNDIETLCLKRQYYDYLLFAFS